jgi:Flp pilus assembly protein TadD
MAKRRCAVNKHGLARTMTAAAATALFLAACQTTETPEPAYTGSISQSAVLTPSDLTPDQALAAVQRWGAAYGQNEKDKLAALNYAAALRAAGQTNQAVAVMRKAAIYHPQDREVLAAFGKALAADGQFKQALATIRSAQRADNPDWQLLATEGGILDSLGNHEGARDLYRQALVLAPAEPQILNNLGLSYVLTNELGKAEEVLREAVASPAATLKTKQNLALVLRLQGKAGEADAIAGTPPPAAPLVQQDTWKDLAVEG